MVRVTATFDVSTIATIISGVASQKIRIYQIHMVNNSTTTDSKVRLASLTPTIDYYGGEDGHIYLKKKGGQFGLGSPDNTIPIFTINTAENLVMTESSGGTGVSGTMIYEIS